jgi:hypothetical protein
MSVIGNVVVMGGVCLIGFGLLAALFSQESANPLKDWMKAGVMILSGVVAIKIGVRRI